MLGVFCPTRQARAEHVEPWVPCYPDPRRGLGRGGMRARRGMVQLARPFSVCRRRSRMRKGRRLLLWRLCGRRLQPCPVWGRGGELPARRRLLLVPLSAERERPAYVCVGLGLYQRRPCLQSRRRVLWPRLRQQRFVRRAPLRRGQGGLCQRQRLLLGRVRGGQVRCSGARVSRRRRDLRRRSGLLLGPVLRTRRGRSRLHAARWLQGGGGDLQQWHGLLLGGVSACAFRHGDLQGAARLQSHRRTVSGREGLLFRLVWSRRSLPGRRRLFCQGRALPVERRLLLGRLPNGPGRCAPL